MFKATKRTFIALILLAAASSPSAAYATFDQQPPASSTRATTHPRASPAVNPCSGSCTGLAYGSPRGTSWQQAVQVAALRQTISPTADERAAVVARCVPIPRGVCLPSARVQAHPAGVASAHPIAASSQKGLQWDDATIVGTGTLLVLSGACTAAIFTRRRNHRATAS
jgi:hypothetical protein